MVTSLGNAGYRSSMLRAMANVGLYQIAHWSAGTVRLSELPVDDGPGGVNAGDISSQANTWSTL
jgi:hypothetical protein